MMKTQVCLECKIEKPITDFVMCGPYYKKLCKKCHFKRYQRTRKNAEERAVFEKCFELEA